LVELKDSTILSSKEASPVPSAISRSENLTNAIHTVGTKSNRDGIGARVRVKAGTRVLVDEVRSGSSYISNSDLRVHFGLGKNDQIDWVEIRWPSGLGERFRNLLVDQIHTLKKGSADGGRS
jgi:enediyne biosynthesis protein E4